jgi:hypothetical protein
VIAFYTGINDVAHVSYVHEANEWFPTVAAENGFSYEATNDWSKLNTEVLSRYRVVIFLDTRPENAEQRAAFQQYMENGGAWLGFHFAAFALTPSTYPMDWDWYHNQFLGSGEYKGNTWAPTTAVLRVEDQTHPATHRLPSTFTASPNEWYSWQTDLRTKSNIRILCSVDSTSFPLGTGPKEWEIWRSGYYPVVWTNTDYKMLYVNMGHNLIDYGNNNATTSFTFANETQNRMIIDALLWMGRDETGVNKWRPAQFRSTPCMDIRLDNSRLTVSRADVREFSASVFDLHGRRVLDRRTTNGVLQFDKKGIGRGVYTVYSSSAAGSATRSFSVQ